MAQSIRIRLKAFDHEIIDQSTKKIVETVTRTDKTLVVVGRQMSVSVIDADGRTRQTFKPGYGTRLYVKDGAKVKPGDKLADWDPFAQPLVSEIAGVAKLIDVVDGMTARDETDEATGISSRVIVDYRGGKGNDLRPAVLITDEKGDA